MSSSVWYSARCSACPCVMQLPQHGSRIGPDPAQQRLPVPPHQPRRVGGHLQGRDLGVRVGPGYSSRLPGPREKPPAQPRAPVPLVRLSACPSEMRALQGLGAGLGLLSLGLALGALSSDTWLVARSPGFASSSGLWCICLNDACRPFLIVPGLFTLVAMSVYSMELSKSVSLYGDAVCFGSAFAMGWLVFPFTILSGTLLLLVEKPDFS
ncbi:hypothetical protein Y1Q_0013909 [Alligator mississippiensis]|uniref:Uncharacterized protein n=1 Tax=Alligator mississippiensis TaxID=8496 RepID=A0A151MVU3_ALLMI|nr:hypothetical protein Y1Q_0013909 [Alligator mississippiensis]